MNGEPPCWHSNFGIDKPGFDQRLGMWLEINRPTRPGMVRRIAPPDMTDPKKQEEVDEAKRNMLKLMAVGGLAAMGGGAAIGGAMQFLQPPEAGLASYPKVQLIFADGTPITTSNITSQIDPTSTDLYLFNYPLSSEGNMLLVLDASYGTPPEGSIGPIPLTKPVSGVTSIVIVSYSAICQHLGCVPPFLSYYPASEAATCSYNGGKPFLHCICHGSSYDPYVGSTSTSPPGGANILAGPTVLPLPQTLLSTDASGNIYAVGSKGPPVKGHISTLIGGNPGPVPASTSKVSVGTLGSGQHCP